MQVENQAELFGFLRNILEAAAENLGDAFFRFLPRKGDDKTPPGVRASAVRFILPALWDIQAAAYEDYWSRQPFASHKPGVLVSAMQRLVAGRIAPLVKTEADNSDMRALLPVETLYEVFTQGLALFAGLEKPGFPEADDRLLNALALKNAELELADRKKDELISLIGRDLQAPLASALGHVECVFDGSMGHLSDKALHAVGMSIRNLRKLAVNLGDLQDYVSALLWVRSGFGNVSGFPLRELLDEVSGDLASEFSGRNQDVKFELEEPGIEASGKRESIYKVFFNLLLNSSRFSGDGSEITVSIGRGPGGEIKVSVADNGPGIPEKIRCEVFKPFALNLLDRETAEHLEGTGLELAVVETILRAHGNRIVCEDAPGGGSTFIFDLPSAVADPEEPARSLPETVETPRRILVIDDDKDARDFTSLILNSEGYAVDGVSTAEKGLEKVSSASFDVLLVDVTLIGMDGIDFCREVKSNPATEGIPVIMVSARSEESVRTRAEEAGCDSYIVKPFRIEPFLELIKTQIVDGTRRKDA